MSPEIARKVVTLFQKTGPPEKLDQQLTPQETRLLKLFAEGLQVPRRRRTAEHQRQHRPRSHPQHLR